MERLGNLLQEVEVLHPYPDVRFASDHPNFGGYIQGKNRVRQERQHGSVRGVSGNRHPYRDRHVACAGLAAPLFGGEKAVWETAAGHGPAPHKI